MLDQLSPSVVVRTSKLEPYVVAKAGLVVDGHYCRQTFIGGFCMAVDASAAAEVAKAEVIERVYALYDVARCQIVNGGFSTLSWPQLKLVNPLPVSRCVLGPHPFGPAPYLDACGLAFHPKIEVAARHGLYEILERHFCAANWYSFEPVVEWREKIQFRNGATVRFFSLANLPNLPFVISVAVLSTGDFVGAGAAIRDSFASSKNHAMLEACLLLDGYLENDRGACASSQDRVLSLREPEIGKRRLTHFERNCVGFINEPSTTLHAQLTPKLLLGGLHGGAAVHVAVLRQTDAGIVVRVSVDEAMSLRTMRLGRPSGFLDDWYC